MLVGTTSWYVIEKVMIIIKQVLKFINEYYELALLITDACNETRNRAMRLLMFTTLFIEEVL